MSNSKTFLLAEIALFTALALILSLISINYAQTFYLELAVIPLVFLSIRRGFFAGLTAGLIYGILLIVLGQATILTPVQAILEYIIAPMSLSIAGFSRNKTVLAAFSAIFLKYFWHFIAGIIFWGKYAWTGWSAWTYSLVTNGISALVTSIVCAILLVILFKNLPKKMLK